MAHSTGVFRVRVCVCVCVRTFTEMALPNILEFLQPDPCPIIFPSHTFHSPSSPITH